MTDLYQKTVEVKEYLKNQMKIKADLLMKIIKSQSASYTTEQKIEIYDIIRKIGILSDENIENLYNQCIIDKKPSKLYNDMFNDIKDDKLNQIHTFDEMTDINKKEHLIRNVYKLFFDKLELNDQLSIINEIKHYQYQWFVELVAEKIYIFNVLRDNSKLVVHKDVPKFLKSINKEVKRLNNDTKLQKKVTNIYNDSIKLKLQFLPYLGTNFFEEQLYKYKDIINFNKRSWNLMFKTHKNNLI